MQASDLVVYTEPSYAEVLDSMYFTTTLGLKHQYDAAPTISDEDHSFSLDFSGGISGTFGLVLGCSTARTLAANFLGEEEDSLTPTEVGDVTGELVNMLCGSLVSRIPSQSDFVLSHPAPAVTHPTPCAPGRLLLSTLETDSGPMQVWIYLEETS